MSRSKISALENEYVRHREVDLRLLAWALAVDYDELVSEPELGWALRLAY